MGSAAFSVGLLAGASEVERLNESAGLTPEISMGKPKTIRKE
jgi:hypothetical protein